MVIVNVMNIPRQRNQIESAAHGDFGQWDIYLTNNNFRLRATVSSGETLGE